MPDPQTPQSFLVADIGSMMTKVGLVENVAGEFRFVAAGASLTTADPPAADVAVGLRSAIRQVQARAERPLLTEDGQLVSPERTGRVGVDAFTMVSSAPLPLRVAIVGLSREISLASAICAVAGVSATIEATLALDETGGRWLPLKTPSPDADKAKAPPVALQDPAVIAGEALAAANPDVIVLVGGVDGGATAPLLDLANLIAVIVAAREESARPVVVFAGNSEARPQIAARIGQVAELRVVDNVRPTMERENWAPLRRELEVLYAERKMTWLPGLNALTQWTPTTALPSAHAFETVVRYLARRYHLSVLGADLGGAATTIVTARGETYARRVRADLGLGCNLERVIAQAGIEQLMDWLPPELSAAEANTYWLNHALHPWTIPTTRVDARLTQAAARAALSQAASAVDVNDLDLCVLTGGLCAYTSNLGAVALLALDALQPCGIFTLAVDGLGLAPAFGGLASLHASAAAGVIERDAFVTLGTVIAPVSKNREGQIDLRLQVQPSGGEGGINLEVQHGSIELVPLAPGQKASIQVRLAGSAQLPHKRGGVFKAEIEGGALGLIIDARGRPIAFPADAAKRRAKTQQWHWDIGGEVTNA
jgi:hypothetical protein